ncbi:hypothetical protein HN51_053438 [Arachis hypogaea]
MAKLTMRNLLSVFLLISGVVSMMSMEVAKGAVCEERWQSPYCHKFDTCRPECWRNHPGSMSFGSCENHHNCVCTYNC